MERKQPVAAACFTKAPEFVSRKNTSFPSLGVRHGDDETNNASLAGRRSISIVSWTLPQNRSWHSSVSIVSSTVLDNRRTIVRFPVSLRELSLLHSVYTSSDTHPTSAAMCTGLFLLRKQICRRLNLTTHLHLVWWSTTFSVPPSLYVFKV